ncbi:MAG: hypothetical protein H0V89_00015 [Deltaproteobacteria bacterium]|nr:hypothetical protein [Deltaproteobacteria bacterium]
MTSLSSYMRRIWRASLTPDALLSAEEACEALPGRPEMTAPWLECNVLPAGEIAGLVVFRWGTILAAVAGTPATTTPHTVQPTPVTTWRGVASALGVSEDTVARHRREHDERTERPWFPTTEAVQEWWRKMHEPRPLRRSAR